MNSIIYPSRNCPACNEKPFESNERYVLKTSTRDICCTCGTVLQTFPAITGITVPKDQIGIPPAVSAVLESLLTRRLFILDKGYQPRRADRNVLDVDRMAKTLAHRAGDQVYITLRGPGNCSAELRWNYSSKALLPRQPWQEFEFKWESSGHTQRQKTELKPLLSNVEFALPSRIVRSCDALSDFDLVSSIVDKRDAAVKTLRLEKRVEIEEQLLDTTQDLVLVIKVELSWLQIGSSFPSETGAREYNLSAMYQGYPQTLEEAVDAAIYKAMYGRESGNVEIHHSRDRLQVMGKVGNPIALHREPTQYYMSCRPVAQNDSALSCNHEADYQGAFDTKNGAFLVPEGLPYFLHVSMPQDQRFNKDHVPPEVQVMIKRGEEVLFDGMLGGPDHKGGYSQYGYRVGYNVCEGELKQTVAGQTITTVISDNGASVERVYKIVSLKEYEAAWDGWRNPIIERYKRQLIAEVTATTRRYYSELGRDRGQAAELKGKQKVAAFIDGRWLEGTYAGRKDGDHIVAVVHSAGTSGYRVSQVLALEDALTDGLDVLPPFNAKCPTGTQSELIVQQGNLQ